jgi:hypothetical protein
MATETQIVKEFVRRFKAERGDDPVHRANHRVPHTGEPAGELQRDNPGRIFNRRIYGIGRWPDNATIKRLHKRIMKKLRQPFRRKARGALRRRAAGKNEVRPHR